MSRPPRWIADATEPTEAEIARISGDDPVLRSASAVTEPSDAEVDRILARMPATMPRRAVPVWPGLVLLPLAVLGLVFWLAPAPPRVEAPNPTISSIPLTDWSATGTGTWTERPGALGTRIVQTAGVVRYQVGIRDLGAGFVVTARDVEVAVVGTVFDVGIEGDAVWVDVLEGLVEVRHAGASVMLGPDSTWTTPSSAVARVDPPPTLRPVAVPPPKAPDDSNSDARTLGRLLSRVDAGERTEPLEVALADFVRGTEGALADAAEAAAIEVSVARLTAETAVETLDTYLRTHPEGPRRLALLELRADLARDGLKDCLGAIPFYRTLVVEATGDQRNRAEAWWGLCAASLGQPDAVEVLSSALDHGVSPPLRDEVVRALGLLQLR